MSGSRNMFRWALALALLVTSMPLGAAHTVVPATAGGAGDAAATWFSSGPAAPAALETGASRSVSEGVAAGAAAGVATAEVRLGPLVAGGGAVRSASTPLYLSHCAFLC